MLSDTELRAELLRLGVNAGPITAATRSTYLKKLNKLQGASKTPANGYEKAVDERKPINGHEPEVLSDVELRAELLKLGQKPGPITSATRSLYVKKLARLRAAGGAVQPNGVDRERRVRSPRVPRPEPDPEPDQDVDEAYEEDPEPMDDSDEPDETDEPAEHWRPPARPVTSYRPEPSPSRYQPTARTLRPDPPPPEPSLSRYQPTARTLRPDPPPPEPSTSRYQPATRTLRPDPPHPEPSLSWRQPAARTLRPDPPHNSGWYGLSWGVGGGAADARDEAPSPYRAEPRARAPLSDATAGADWRPAPPSYRSGSLRQRVADWCRPSAAPADYDTCSDSEPDDAEERPLSPSQQLQAFRRRMGRDSRAERPQSERAGLRAALRLGASHLVPYLILLLAIVFFGALVLAYLRLARSDDVSKMLVVPPDGEGPPAVGVFPICGSLEEDGRGCVQREQLQQAVDLLPAVQPALAAAARDALCGRRQNQSVTLTELAQLTDTDTSVLRDLATVVAYNRQLELRADLASDEVSLTALGISTPWLCHVAAALHFLVTWAATIGAAVVGVALLREVLVWRRRSREKQQNELYQMVESIMDVVRQHTLPTTGAEKPYVAVDHVRDELLTPAERSSQQHVRLWQRACQFIRDRESRVREECVMVAGESHTVWRWLPTSGGAGRDKRKVWLGQAFQTSSGVNTPVHTRTSCLKIRHMFDPSSESGSGWQQEIRDALLEKCDNISVMHIAIDEHNPEGLVYAKCRSDEDALSAFKRIQGCWFDGRLVSVKFIRLERYHERYPEAAGATEPLRPSNALRRSLAGIQPAAADDD